MGFWIWDRIETEITVNLIPSGFVSFGASHIESERHDITEHPLPFCEVVASPERRALAQVPVPGCQGARVCVSGRTHGCMGHSAAEEGRKKQKTEARARAERFFGESDLEASR